jgi:hypothetical protein
VTLDLLGNNVKADIEKNKRAAEARWSKIKDWTQFSNRVERHFLHAAEEAKESDFFCSIYVSKQPDHKQIQLFTGSHSTGDSKAIRNEFGQKTGQKLIAESGGTLVVSQSTLGDVAIILYPLKSENLSRIKDKIIWSVSPSPGAISSRMLDSAIRDFFVYLRVSSALLNESRYDRFKIAYLEFRASKYEGKGHFAKIIFSKRFWPAVVAFGTVVSIVSGLKSLAG